MRTKCRFCPWGGGPLFLTEFARSQNRPELVSQWDAEGNGALLPGTVSSGSDRKVWWRCEAGHTWQARVSARALMGRGCPYCAGQLPIPGQTDLATRYPEAAALWHPTENGTVTPDQVMPGSHKKYWWLCEQGHAWQAAPYVLTSQNALCPYCSGRRPIPGQTDLATTHPDLARQWHPEKNGTLTPDQVSAGSEKQAWWLCERGHDYRSMVFSRVQGTGCPYCAGRKAWPGFNDLNTLYPALAAQWHPDLNGSLTPRQVTRGSHRKVWWQCPEGHVWKTVVFARTRERSSGCPVCAGTTKAADRQAVRMGAAHPLGAPPRGSVASPLTL